MSFDFGEANRHKNFASKEENEIREIFYHLWERMKNQTRPMFNRIEKWRADSIRRIEVHADKQIQILQADYTYQLTIFHTKREDNVDTAKRYRQSKAIDPFKELSNACRSLQFQMAQLDFIQYESTCPRVITVEMQREGKRPIQFNTLGYGSENNPTSAMGRNASREGRNGSNSAGSALQASLNETGDWSIVDPPSGADYRSTSSNDSNSKGQLANVNDSPKKCIICCMIYPLNMTENDRQKHYEEHVLDIDDGNNVTSPSY